MIAPFWLPVFSLLAAAPQVPVPFSTWFDARVEAEKPTVVSRFSLDLDGDGREDDVACYSFGEGAPPRTLPVVLVGLATGERFALVEANREVGVLGECPQREPRREGDRLEVLPLRLSDPPGKGWSLGVRFDARGPLLARVLTSTHFLSDSLDLRSQRSVHQQSSTREEVAHETAALVASDLGESQPAPVWVSWGRKDWRGPADAALKVRTLLRRDAKVTVIAEWKDDRDVRARDDSPRAVLAADHLELWWSESATPRPRPVQLGVAVDREGRPVMTWLQPPEDTAAGMPAVRWLPPARLEVDLPLAWLMPKPRTAEELALDAEQNGGPWANLTVAFSDSDGKGQETLVSTTSQRPGEGSFSGLFLAEPGAPFPRLGTRALMWRQVQEGDTLRGLTGLR